MELTLIVLAVFSLVVGLIGLVWSIAELWRTRSNYTPPKRKRRSTYVGR